MYTNNNDNLIPLKTEPPWAINPSLCIGQKNGYTAWKKNEASNIYGVEKNGFTKTALIYQFSLI
jgi:hypothetical protein